MVYFRGPKLSVNRLAHWRTFLHRRHHSYNSNGTVVEDP